MIGVLHPLIYFPLYEKSKIYFLHNWQQKGDQLESRYVFVSAITCKAFTSLITYPHEVVRARQQDTRGYEHGKNHGKHTLRYVIRSIMAEGPHVFYAGWFTNLMRITPHYAITFVLYEKFSQKFHELLD